MVRKLGSFLTGTLVQKAKKKGVAGVIGGVRSNVRGVNQTYVIDFDCDVLPGVSSWPVPDRQADFLADKISRNERDWVGYGVKLAVKDYSDKGFPPGLVVVSVATPAVASKSRKSKPQYFDGIATGSDLENHLKDAPLTDEECPF